jgi:hypothetical protein
MMATNQPPSCVLPRLEELVGPWSVPPGLASKYEELAKSGRVYDHYTAMGLVTNRFLPSSRDELAAYVKSGYDHQFESRITDWLMTQSPTDMKEVARLAELEALNLVTEFDKLEAKRWPINDLLLLALAREMLEGVATIIRRRGYASRVMPIINKLDEVALARLPFDKLPAPLFRPELLLAVREQAPKKWWGRILGSYS